MEIGVEVDEEGAIARSQADAPEIDGNVFLNGITELEPGYCHIRLQADLRAPRNEHLGFGALFLGGGAIGTAVLASTGALLVLMPIPVIAGAGLASVIWRSYRPTLARTRLGLERALDHLERGTVKPGHELPSKQASLLQVVTNEVRKALGS